MKQPLYLALATLLQRQRNLARKLETLHPSDETSFQHFLMMKDHVEDVLLDLCKEHLPSGSGFNAGTTLAGGECEVEGRPFPGRLLFETSFHHMDDGFYSGWTEHRISVVPAFGGFELKVSGKNRDGIKEYIEEVFHNVLMTDVEYEPTPKRTAA